MSHTAAISSKLFSFCLDTRGKMVINLSYISKSGETP